MRASSVTNRSTFRGASSGSPSSLELAFEPRNRAQCQLDAEGALARIFFRQDMAEDVETPRAVIDRDRERTICRAPRRAQRIADTLERRDRIDRVAAKFLGERRFAAGVVRATLGDNRTGAGNEAHADVAVAAFPQIVNRIVMGGLGWTVGGEPSFGYTGSAKSRYEGRQARGPDLDFVVICGGAIVQPHLDLARGNARPISGVDRDDIVGAGARCDRQQRSGEQPAEPVPVRGSRKAVNRQRRRDLPSV